MVGWMSNNQAPSTQMALPPEAKARLPTPGHVETIMLYGQAKSGKTTAACSMIEAALAKDPATKIFYVATGYNEVDLTMDWYFQNRKPEILTHMQIFKPYEFKEKPEPFFNQVAAMFHSIRTQAKPNDWLVVDLADKFYGWAQDAFVEQSSPQNNTTTYLLDAARDVKRFTEFNRLMWAWIKRMDSIATFDVVERPPCNLLYIFGEKEMEIEDTVEDQQTPNANDMFRLVGCKPEGQKRLCYAFSTIVYLSGLKEKQYTVLGDRGFATTYKEHPYERSWYKSFLETRGKSV